MKTISGASSKHDATKLATSLAMMHATLESTTDAILVTHEANYVTEFKEKYEAVGNSAQHDGNGACLRFVGLRRPAIERPSRNFRDITQRKRAEDALANEKRVLE